MILNQKTLCIALPTVNEVENLKILLPELFFIFPEADILIIDDASSDGTQEYLNQLMMENSRIKLVYRSTRLGIGSAHLFAMTYAYAQHYEFLITMDADLTHDSLDASQLFNLITVSDFVIGSRYLGKNDIEGWSKFRLFLTHGGHIITRVLFSSKLDMSSGLRAYRVNKIPIRSISLNCPPNYEFFFISTLVFLRTDCDIKQIRVKLTKRGSGKSKMTFRLMLRGVGQLLLYGLRIKKLKLI